MIQDMVLENYLLTTVSSDKTCVMQRISELDFGIKEDVVARFEL